MSHTLELYNKFHKNQAQNPHLIPKISKIVVSMGLGLDGSDKKLLEGAIKELTAITGNKPVITKAKKSVANFKLRQGQIIGIYVTLRKNKMYEFLDRLIYLSLPRIHDFRGFSKKSFDKNGNFCFGVPDHLIFSELSYDMIAKMRGLNISFHVKSPEIEKTIEMFKMLMIPIK